LPLEVRYALELDAEVQAEVMRLCVELGIRCDGHPRVRLGDWCGARDHQGLIALMPPYPYAPFEKLLQLLPERPLLIVLDHIQDPHNLGSILRSAEVFGVDGVVVPEVGQAAITPHVVRSSAGAVNRVSIAQVSDLAAAATALSDQRQVHLLVAAGDADASIEATDLRGGIAFVIGNEGSGVDPELRRVAAGAVRIPQCGRTESLNAAVAAGVLLYEARRQRGFGRANGIGP
jgi:23S rRNA (guanosine2251-2'-O)-methyltransferase